MEEITGKYLKIIKVNNKCLLKSIDNDYLISDNIVLSLSNIFLHSIETYIDKIKLSIKLLNEYNELGSKICRLTKMIYTDKHLNIELDDDGFSNLNNQLKPMQDYSLALLKRILILKKELGAYKKSTDGLSELSGDIINAIKKDVL